MTSPLKDWLAANPMSPSDVDCATTVMLKILDGKCKMKPVEKQVMTLLYSSVSHLPGNLFDESMHQFIERTRHSLTEDIKLEIYEQRVLAETVLSRPVMKEFKARIRSAGLFAACDIQATETLS
ncbi:hypothetical protein WKI13_14160 [Teredinibacter turnerae]|uniref:hypothetical protein n=1 Tax=Teredinibacter turnerae TaxID=2426 RepID=UPI00037F6204|nr:hypothetical protein [Teredinibacter turnerae]